MLPVVPRTPVSGTPLKGVAAPGDRHQIPLIRVVSGPSWVSLCRRITGGEYKISSLPDRLAGLNIGGVVAATMIPYLAQPQSWKGARGA
jgi:hypothetical protein